MQVKIADKVFKVMGPKIKVTEKFAGGGVPIDGSHHQRP